MKIQESAENYLETILILKEKKGVVRSIDIVHYMNFSKPSISRAVNLLKDNGYITIDKDGWIELTQSGLEIAQRIYERHRILTDLLIRLGVSESTARADACRIEHDLSDETWQKIKDHAKAHAVPEIHSKKNP